MFKVVFLKLMLPVLHNQVIYSLVYSPKISINLVSTLVWKRIRHQKMSNNLTNLNQVSLVSYLIKINLVLLVFLTIKQVIIYSHCQINLYLAVQICSIQLLIHQNQVIFSPDKQRMKTVNKKVTVLNFKKNNKWYLIRQRVKLNMTTENKV